MIDYYVDLVDEFRFLYVASGLLGIDGRLISEEKFPERVDRFEKMLEGLQCWVPRYDTSEDNPYKGQDNGHPK